MTKTLNAISKILLTLAVVDLLILFTSMAQIGLEGRTGHWNPFWRAQAQFVVGLLN